jgi:DNA-binding transcriptional LysR family regulator
MAISLQKGVRHTELRQLRYFLAIAQEKQITAAARKLNIAQPPLSFQLKALEDELGVTLVERGPRNIRLTAAGEMLRKRAEQILELESSAIREVSDCGKGMSGALTVGMISSSGAVVKSESIEAFRRDYPLVSFEIYEGNTFEVIDMLEKGIIELGIVRTPFKTAGLNMRFAPPEPMMAAASYDMGPGTSIPVSALDGKPVVLYRRFDALLREVFDKNGVSPFIRCRNDDARSTLMWAQAGFGIGILPRSALKIFGSGGLCCREIDSPELRTSLAVIWEKGRYLSALGKKFADSLGFGDE